METQAPATGIGLLPKGSAMTGHSVCGGGEKFARRPIYPPLEQIVSAFAIELSPPTMPLGLAEFE